MLPANLGMESLSYFLESHFKQREAALVCFLLSTNPWTDVSPGREVYFVKDSFRSNRGTFPTRTEEDSMFNGPVCFPPGHGNAVDKFTQFILWSKRPVGYENHEMWQRAVTRRTNR